MRRRLQLIASALLIVTGLVGCDNVVWGGADVQVVPPPPPLSEAEVETDSITTAQFGLPEITLGAMPGAGASSTG